jgi:glycosyltransferase involved in cell wall biosynthesis
MPVLDFALFYNYGMLAHCMRPAFSTSRIGDRALPELASMSRSGPPGPAESTPLTKIFLMTNTLEVGGSERQFALLIESLNRNRFEIHASCLRRIGGLVARVGEIPEFPPGGSLFGIQSLRARQAMMQAMRRDAIAVAHAFDFYSNLMLIPAARLAGIPVIGSHRQLGDLLTPAQFKAQYWAFRFSDRVVCNSDAAAATLRAAGLPDQKLAIIPNGLPEAAFANCAPALPYQPGIVRIGMIARMNNAVKNHPMLLRAAAELLKQISGIQFVLVGDGPLRPGLEQMSAELGIKENIRFLGERHDIPAVLASLDISVLLSSSESLSNSILESMAAGVPVVATSVGGTPELVKDGETGFLIPPGEEKKLVETLARLVRDPALRRQYAARSRQFARERFHISEVSRRFEQLYLSLA